MRGTFNTKPKLVKWAYTGVVRPKLTYASIAWCNGLFYEYQNKELYKLDRLACRAMATLSKTTPQAALNIMFDLVPLHLHIQELAISAYNRLEAVIGVPWEPVNRTKKAPHLWYLKQLLDKYCLTLPATDACQENIWDRNFVINTDSFDGTRKHRQHSEYTIYTDGSKTSGGVGAGFVVYYRKELIHTGSVITDCINPLLCSRRKYMLLNLAVNLSAVTLLFSPGT